MERELHRQWTAGPYDFSALDGHSFERLVQALLAAEGYDEVSHEGQRGRDRGVDLRARHEGARVAVQCKAWSRLPKGEALKELEKLLGRDDRFDRYLLVVAGTCAMDAVRTALEDRVRAADLDPPLAIDLWSRSELDLLAKRHREVVADVVRGEPFVAGSKLVYLSAARADRDWAAAFRQDLEAGLRHAVAGDWEVRWDDPEIDGGLPEIPDGAGWGVVVVTPEALAADRQLVATWRTALAPGARSGRRRLLAVSLAPAPWPSWLEESFERVEVRDDPELYRIDLAAILSKWIGTAEENLPERLRELKLKGPGPRPERLPDGLRERLIGWLEPLMEVKGTRRGLASALRLEPRTLLDELETALQQASAAVVLAQGDDDSVKAALRLLAVVCDEREGQESAERLGELDRLSADLHQLQAGSPEPAQQGLLAAWLRKVEQDHERLVDYFQQRHELDLLDRVYVELEISAARPEDLLDGDGERGLGALGRPLAIQELLELDPEDQPWVTRRWLVRGDPGAGKTTLLRHLAARLARDWRPGSWIPVFQSLPVLMRSEQALLDRLEKTFYRSAGLKGLSAVLDREGQEGRLLVLLDGLDEVGEARPEAESLIRYLSERWPRSALMVTTRPIGYRRFATELRELQLLPFDRGRRHDFLASWFGRADGHRDEARAERALRELDESGLADLSSNPLYLTRMAMLLEKGTSPSKNRSKLYDQVFDLLLEGKHKHGRVPPIERPELVRRVLRLLAYTMTVEDVGAEPENLLLERLYRGELDEARAELRKVPRWDGQLKLFLDDVAEKVGIFGPHDGEDADWRFWHRTFREALVAEHLAGGSMDSILAHATGLGKGEASRWAEPYALLSGRVKEPDQLVRSLVESNRALGLRALATAQGVSDETLDEILELTPDLEERAQVYEQIADRLEDPERALQLIDRLRRRTRNGYEVYFLDRAAALVGERWDGWAAEAERLRRRLYDHVGAPAEEVARFFAFRTPAGEEKALWSEIPRGVGWVGSPEAEAGRQVREGPRHRVEIQHRFWMAAVPVTNAQYAVFDPGKASRPWLGISAAELPDHPRVDVTWYEAVSFCRWLAFELGLEGARLPSEEEWEYACRAGSATRFWAGDEDLAEVGWYENNSGNRTHRVGGKQANDFGLRDAHGNVWEWTATEWDEKRYGSRPQGKPYPIDPAAPAADLAGGAHRVRRVVRGGCCWGTALRCRSAYRGIGGPGLGFGDLGFRVLLSSAPSRPSMVDL
ncbi:MAG: SUMF1/EgtB/PvdO family nonheme iron enzyme [Thermoanaerobaculia bacterium]